MKIRDLRNIKNIAAVILIVAGLVVFYWPTWAGLNEKWSLLTQSYSHGYLIAVISLGLLLQSASKLPRSVGQYRWLAAVALLGISASR